MFLTLKRKLFGLMRREKTICCPLTNIAFGLSHTPVRQKKPHISNKGLEQGSSIHAKVLLSNSKTLFPMRNTRTGTHRGFRNNVLQDVHNSAAHNPKLPDLEGPAQTRSLDQKRGEVISTSLILQFAIATGWCICNQHLCFPKLGVIGTT